MRWIVSRWYALTNWWYDIKRARQERLIIMELLRDYQARLKADCHVCDDQCDECICGERDCD